MNEIKLGKATYQVRRSFSEDCSLSDLIVARLIREKEEKTAFDGSADGAYNALGGSVRERRLL